MSLPEVSNHYTDVYQDSQTRYSLKWGITTQTSTKTDKQDIPWSEESLHRRLPRQSNKTFPGVRNHYTDVYQESQTRHSLKWGITIQTFTKTVKQDIPWSEQFFHRRLSKQSKKTFPEVRNHYRDVYQDSQTRHSLEWGITTQTSTKTVKQDILWSEESLHRRLPRQSNKTFTKGLETGRQNRTPPAFLNSTVALYRTVRERARGAKSRVQRLNHWAIK